MIWNKEIIKSKYLFLIPGESLEIHEVDFPSSALRMGDRQFVRKDDEDTHGFYDYLRVDSSSVIGMRIFFFEDYQWVVPRFLGYTYVASEKTIKGNTLIYLFFGEDRKYNESLSQDQLFTGNYLYFSPDGKFGLSFEAPG